MSYEPSLPDDNDLPEEFAELIRSMFGENADDALEAIKASGFDLAHLFETAGISATPANMRFLAGQIRHMMEAGGTSPVNWEVAHDLARQTAVKGGDPIVNGKQIENTDQAFALAEQWLDDVTDFSADCAAPVALSSTDWVEITLGCWQQMTEPIAASVADALASTLSQHGEIPGAPDFGHGATNMLRTMGGSVFGMQVGQAVGTLSREVFGLTDIGFPLGPKQEQTAMLPAAVDRFSEGLDVPADEVRIFLATREAAHARLFTHAPWLKGYLLGAVETYAKGITIDLEKLEEQVRSIDPTDTEALRRALSGGVFEIEPTPPQQASLERLETALALVEGWVDEVSMAAVGPYLPNAARLGEMMRRRRAAGGPAEHVFTALIGLQLRPRRAREAAELWAALDAHGGPGERDAQWSHPDILPTAEDLDDPAGFVGRRQAAGQADAAIDAAIEELLSGAESGASTNAEPATGEDAVHGPGTATGAGTSTRADGPDADAATPPEDSGAVDGEGKDED